LHSKSAKLLTAHFPEIADALRALEPATFILDGELGSIDRLLSHTVGTSVLSVPWFPANSKLPTLEAVLRGEAVYYRNFPERDRGPVKLVREPGSKWA